MILNDSRQILFKCIHACIGMDRRETLKLMLVYTSGKYINRSTATYFAESDAGVQPVHKIVNVDSQLRIQRVQPLGQILFHRDQILLRGLERPVRPRFQKHRHIASTIPETPIDRTLVHVRVRVRKISLRSLEYLSSLKRDNFVPRIYYFTNCSRNL